MSIGKVSRIIDKNNTKADVVDLENYAIPVHVAYKQVESDVMSYVKMLNTEQKKYVYIANGYYKGTETNYGFKGWVRDYYKKFKKAPKIEINVDTYYDDEETGETIHGTTLCINAPSLISPDDEEEENAQNIDVNYVHKINDQVYGVNKNGDDPCRTYFWYQIEFYSPVIESNDTSSAITICVNDVTENYIVNSGTITMGNIEVDAAVELRYSYNWSDPGTNPELYFDDTIILPPIPSDTEEE